MIVYIVTMVMFVAATVSSACLIHSKMAVANKVVVTAKVKERGFYHITVTESETGLFGKGLSVASYKEAEKMARRDLKKKKAEFKEEVKYEKKLAEGTESSSL